MKDEQPDQVVSAEATPQLWVKRERFNALKQSARTEIDCGQPRQAEVHAPPMTDSEESMEVPTTCEPDVPERVTVFRCSCCGVLSFGNSDCPHCNEHKDAQRYFQYTRTAAQGSERVAAEMARELFNQWQEDSGLGQWLNPQFGGWKLLVDRIASALAASPSLSGAPGELKEVQECDSIKKISGKR